MHQDGLYTTTLAKGCAEGRVGAAPRAENEGNSGSGIRVQGIPCSPSWFRVYQGLPGFRVYQGLWFIPT